VRVMIYAWTWIGPHFMGSADVFGSGKVLGSARLIDKDGSPYRRIFAAVKGFEGEMCKNERYTLTADERRLKDFC